MEPENTVVCFGCGQIIREDVAQDYHGVVVCAPCYNSHFEHCICCGDSYDRNYEEQRLGAWGGMCCTCSDEHFVCEECGETCHLDSCGEDGLCQDCVNKEYGRIKGYHTGADGGIQYQPYWSSDSVYFGIELETDDYDDRVEASNELYALSQGETLFWQEEDSSLQEGIEIISQPCTLDYHRDSFPWSKIREIVRKHGGLSERTGTSALHIHFSLSFFNGQGLELRQLRLIYLFEKFREQLAILARTSDYLLSRSAQEYRYERDTLFHGEAEDRLAALKSRYGRYMAVNLENRNTIEIRLFRGTLSRRVILASIELVDFLIRLAKNTETRTLQRLSWKGLLKRIRAGNYQFLPAYLIEKEADKLKGRRAWGTVLGLEAGLGGDDEPQPSHPAYEESVFQVRREEGGPIVGTLTSEP